MRRLRVLHIHVALYQPYLMVKALRKLGHKADSVVFGDKSIKWLIHDADFFLGNKSKPSDIWSVIKFFNYAIKNYDVFHFHSQPGFIPQGRWKLLDSILGIDLWFLKKIGKKIIFSHWGCFDGRIPSRFALYENNRVCSECNRWDNLCSDEYVAKKCSPQMKYADCIINHDPDFEDYNNGALYIHGLIDTDFWNPNEKIPKEYILRNNMGNSIKVYHGVANSHKRGGFEKNIKGSEYIKGAVVRLRDEGYKVDFIYYERTPNRELKYYQLQADIIIDQLFYGWMGSTTREGMALGKPVITFIRKEWLANQMDELPVINADPGTIYQVLKDLVKNEQLRKEIGSDARKFAVEKLDYRIIGRKLEKVYYDIS